MTDNIRHFPPGGRRRQPSGTWLDNLLRTEKNTFRANLANTLIALRQCPMWDGRLAFDKFAGRTMLIDNPPWHDLTLEPFEPREWCNVDDILLAEWLQLQGIYVGPGVAAAAVEAVAHEHGFDPVRDYLGGLVWDGVPRLPGWLSQYLGAELSPYSVGVGMRWMVSAVARIDRPGEKVDHVLILEGGQGRGKSLALEMLGGPWFTDQLSSLDSKDSSVDLQGAWIVELGELDSIAKADISKVKQFLTRRVDRYRPPYGRRVESFPRRCVFAGTHNPTGPWNKDATGGRRFWPVKVGSIDLKALERDRDQLWAEAVNEYRNGFNWWMTSNKEIQLAEAEQAARQDLDVWHDPIAAFLEDDLDVQREGRVTIPRILNVVCGVETKHRTQAHQNRVAGVLTTLGWERKQYRDTETKKQVWGYVRPKTGDRKKPMESKATPAEPVTTPPLSPVSTAETGDRNSPLKSTLSPVSPVSPVENQNSAERDASIAPVSPPTGDTGDKLDSKGKKPVTRGFSQTGDRTGDKETGDRLSGFGLLDDELYPEIDDGPYPEDFE